MIFFTRTLTLCVAMAATTVLGCQQQDQPTKQETPPLAVSVKTITLGDIPLTQSLAGRTVATEVSEVRPQVNGIIDEILFQEGTMVQAGQPLYRLNIDSYASAVAGAEAALNQATANLGTANAMLLDQQARYEQAHADLARMAGLLEIDAISRQAYDNAVTALKTAEAGVQQAQARIASSEATIKTAESGLAASRLDLERTIIRAPLTGKTGISSVSRGALVSSGQAQSLVTISRLDPIYVDIAQSSADILRLRQGLSEGSTSQGSTEVQLILEDGSVYPLSGQLALADAQVDERTGSITLRAIFPNPEQLLLPGMYVNALVQQSVVTNAALLPPSAVIHSPDGNTQVALVDKNNKIELRDIHLEGTHQGQWIVTAGLSSGDRVITVGGNKLSVGQNVIIKPSTKQHATLSPTGQNSVLAPQNNTPPHLPVAAVPPPRPADPSPTTEPVPSADAPQSLSFEEQQALAQAD